MKAKKNNVALTRTSAFREDRKNYLTEDGYTYWRWDEDLKKEVPVHIGLGEEYTDPDALEREAGEGDVMIVSIWNRKGTIFEGWSRTSMSATPTRCSLTDLLVMSVPARAVRMW